MSLHVLLTKILPGMTRSLNERDYARMQEGQVFQLIPLYWALVPVQNKKRNK